MSATDAINEIVGRMNSDVVDIDARLLTLAASRVSVDAKIIAYHAIRPCGADSRECVCACAFLDAERARLGNVIDQFTADRAALQAHIAAIQALDVASMTYDQVMLLHELGQLH